MSGFIKHNQSEQTCEKVFSSIVSWTFQQKYQCPNEKGKGDWARVFYYYTNTALKPNHVQTILPWAYRESLPFLYCVTLWGWCFPHFLHKVQWVFGTSTMFARLIPAQKESSVDFLLDKRPNKEVEQGKKTSQWKMPDMCQCGAPTSYNYNCHHFY